MVKKYIVSLTAEEQGELKATIRRRNEKARAVKRAYVLLAADEHAKNLANGEIAGRRKIMVRSTVGIRKCFVEEGFQQVVYGKNRTVFKEKLSRGRVEAHLIALRCSDLPKGHSARTLHLLADHMVHLG